jgi:Putative prokaryotic signal transducing protein
LQVLRTFDNYIKANIALSKLQNEGIPCALADEHSATINPILLNAIGGIKLVVHKEHIYRAQKLMWQIEQEFWENAVCSNCNASGLTLEVVRTPQNIFVSIFTWLIANRAVPVHYEYKCDNCNASFNELPDLNTQH